MGTIRPYRDLAGLAAWSGRLLAAQAVLAALSVAAALLHGPGFDDESGSPLWWTMVLLAFLIFIAGGVVVLRWIYFANANVRALGAQELNASPAMAVGSYFIPIVNLGMPFQSMREIWKASVNPRDWEIVRAPAIIGWWWMFWLLSCFAGIISFRLGLMEEAGFQPAEELLQIAADTFTIPASLILIRIIGRITAQQAARVREGLA